MNKFKLSQRFYRLFWTNRIRNAVDDYRQKDICNEQGVKTLNGTIRNMLIIWIILASIIMLALIETTELNHLMIGYGLIPFLVKLETYMSLTISGRVYVAGKKKDVVSLGVSTSVSGLQIISFMESEDNGRKDVIRFSNKHGLKKEDWPERGEVFEMYYDNRNKAAFPNVDYLKRQYSLTTEIF